MHSYKASTKLNKAIASHWGRLPCLRPCLGWPRNESVGIQFIPRNKLEFSEKNQIILEGGDPPGVGARLENLLENFLGPF